jgi:hypothetical protein
MKVIPNKEVNKYNSNSYYSKKNNQLLYNNSGINKAQINNTHQKSSRNII